MQHSRNEESIEKRVKELQLHLQATNDQDDMAADPSTSPMSEDSSSGHLLDTTKESSSFLDISQDDLERFDQRASAMNQDVDDGANGDDDVDASIDEIFGNDYGKKISKKRGLKKGGFLKGMISKQRKLENSSSATTTSVGRSFDSDEEDNNVFNDDDDDALFTSSEVSTFPQQSKRSLLDSDEE
jgi:hypothetical protein